MRLALFLSTLAAVLLLAAPASASSSKDAFGFNGSVSGFPTGAVTLTGGGAYDLGTGFVKSAGGFSCTADVGQGPLKGCLAGEGVRWDTAELLSGTDFKCTGADTESKKHADTGDKTVVLLADFYRAGDGIDESFTAQMIVSENDPENDLDPATPGVQNLWVQGVGCGSAIANFN